MSGPADRDRHSPLRVAMLLDGNEEYGLPFAVSSMLSALDRSRVVTHGLFLGDGEGRRMLAPRFDAVHCLNTGPLFPWRRAGRRKFDPIFLAGRLLALLRSLRALKRWFQAEPPDILHTHTWRMAVLGWWASRRLGIRRIWHCHGAYPLSGRMSRRFIRLADRGAAHRVAAISGFVADTLPPELKARATVVYNGVDVERLRGASRPGEFRRRYQVRPDQPLAGIFGAVVPIKGHVYFLEAAARVVQRLPEARFAVVGGTTDAFVRMGALEELTGHIRRLGLERHVIQTGFVPDVARYLSDFDVVAMPSISTPAQAGEGFGLVLIEAMSQESPVVATRCGAAPEIITDGTDGLLVPPRDGAALGEAMLRLLEDRALRSRLTSAALETVRQRFDARVTAASLQRLYAEAATK